MITWNESALKTDDRLRVGDKDVLLIANGDRRRTANDACQAAQMECERQLREAFAKQGYNLLRAHPEIDPDRGHGFIETQAHGRDIFARIPRHAPILVAEAVWQYSNHVAYNLWEHDGPILIASNFDGTWPGLVGALGLEACLAKRKYRDDQAGHCLLWSSEGFTDEVSRRKIAQWLETGTIEHDLSHVRAFVPGEHDACAGAVAYGAKVAEHFRARPRIIGIYDPLCMGMLNAAFDEQEMVGTGIQIRRLNQSDLFARMQEVPADEAKGYMDWIVNRGFTLKVGSNAREEITEAMVEESGQMYGAIVKHVAEEGLDGIGIAYQLGLAKLCAASDVVESMLNSTDRPPVLFEGREVMAGEPIMCANEADMGCAVDQALSKAIYKGITDLDPRWWETTQHDLRWGETYTGTCLANGDKEIPIEAFVWVLELSGNTPAGHMANGWADLEAVRQPYTYFHRGGICTKGVTKPGEIIWSRVYIHEGVACLDIGRGAAVGLPPEESERRWSLTTKEWPLMHAITYGVSRDQMMARHKSNHVTVSYAPDAAGANEIALAKASLAHALGFQVHLCGSLAIEDSLEHHLAHGLPIQGPHIR